MPDGSAAAAPVTKPGPSSRNKIFPRLAGDFLISFLKEFMARSSNKAVQLQDFYALQPTLLISLDDADLALGSVSTLRPSDADAGSKASVRRRDPAQSADIVSQPSTVTTSVRRIDNGLNWFHFSRADTAQEPPAIRSIVRLD